MSIGIDPATRAPTNGGASEEEVRARARKRVEELRGFYVHAAIFVIVNSALFLIDWFASQDATWFYWPLLGWGVGFAAHAVAILFGGPFGAAWEERKTRELVERYQRVGR